MTWHLPFVVLLALDAAAIVALFRFAMFAPLGRPADGED